MTNVIDNEHWRVADQIADFLSIDRDTCRRAFYHEPEERVREVVRRALAELGLPESDPERMIEGWAREHGAGVYGENGRSGGSLEHVEGIVARTILGRGTAA